MVELNILIDNPERLLFHSIKNRIELLVGRIWIDSYSNKLENQIYCNIQVSTTSFLTATTLIYATRAGITAAAGTRLAL
jgi:hypothetical protein